MNLNISKFLLACIIFMSACTTVEQTYNPTSQWSYGTYTAEGKMAIRYPKCDPYRGCKQESYSASYTWEHSLSQDQIKIYTPFGQEIAALTYQGNQVTILNDDGKQTISQAKMADELGFSIPVEDIKEWIFQHRTKEKFFSDPWNVELSQWKSEGYYRVITTRYGEYYLKILINDIKNKH